MPRLLSFLALIFVLTACAPAISTPTTTVEIPPTSTSASLPTKTPTATDTAMVKLPTPEPTAAPTVEPFDLGTVENPGKCTPDDLPTILANEEAKFKYPEGTPNGTWHIIPSRDKASPFHSGQIELSTFCKLSGTYHGADVTGLYLIGVHIEQNGDQFVHIAISQDLLNELMTNGKLDSSNLNRLGILNLTDPDSLNNVKSHEPKLFGILNANIDSGSQGKADELLNGGGGFPDLSGIIFISSVL